MDIPEVLAALGITRVIWIDDGFKEEAELADMLINSIETAKKCVFPGLADILERFGISNLPHELQQFVLDLTLEQREQLKQEFFQHETQDKELPTNEMLGSNVAAACDLLGVSVEDRWTFQKAHAQLQPLCAAGDEAIAYLIDLNESGGSPTEGLTILEGLRTYGSKGTAFILTHEATALNEGDVEQRLRRELREPARTAPNPLEVPVCVVSKERLSDDATLEAALKVAIKRAGLRRSVHEVLSGVASVVERGFLEAAEMLLQIPAEQLDQFVVERGHNEGVSELHVLERAITAKISERLRTMFATDAAVQSSTTRVRTLRGVELPDQPMQPHAHLADFRKLEVWESSELLNRAFTPIASGDVFEAVVSELPAGQPPRRFLLLGQPCDIAIRSDGTRDQNAGYFIPLKSKAGAADGQKKLKEAFFQFHLDGEQWVCDFRASTVVNLPVLDLASLREDGCVRVDRNQAVPDRLLSGLARAAENRMATAAAHMAKDDSQPGTLKEIEFQLSFRSDGVYKHVQSPKLIAETEGAEAAPRRVSWSLKRVGRVRMPYASALLRDLLAVSGREAFDLDFAKPAVEAA
jgi:hypothetical protein